VGRSHPPCGSPEKGSVAAKSTALVVRGQWGFYICLLSLAVAFVRATTSHLDNSNSSFSLG